MTQPTRSMDPDDIALKMGQPSAPEMSPALIAWRLVQVLGENERLRAENRGLRLWIAAERRRGQAIGRILDAALHQLRDTQRTRPAAPTTEDPPACPASRASR